MARGAGTRSSMVALLMMVMMMMAPAWAAPKAGGHRPEPPAATGPDPDPDPDPLSPELPPLPLLRSAVRSLGPPARDVESMTRDQALLYLFALHDHDRSGRLDGLELLQLLGAVLAQRDRGRPDPEAVAALVDRTLERQDLSRDGLLDPPELLLSPGRGPPGLPLLQQPGEPRAGGEAVPGGDTEVAGGDTGGSSLTEGRGLPDGGAHPEGQAAPKAESVEGEEAPEAEAPEAEIPEAESPDAESIEAEEAPEAGAPEGEAAPVWGGPGEE